MGQLLSLLPLIGESGHRETSVSVSCCSTVVEDPHELRRSDHSTHSLHSNQSSVRSDSANFVAAH